MLTGKSCCGCRGCEQACPQKCVTFFTDKEGFLYPEVDETRCTECGVCLKKCPVYTKPECGKSPKVFAAKIKDKQTAFGSTSGGVFSAVAEHILDNGGVVYGCAFDESLTARHIAVESKAELQRLRSSKYVQSDLSGVFSALKKELKNGRQVLFSGTGCQCAGLKNFLGRDYDNLILTDIVCHGVPSPLLFEKYLEYKGSKMGGKITAYNFRSKEKRGWDLYYKAETAGTSKSDYGFFDPYYNAFLNCKTYRESCYVCKYANSSRTGDITLADYWGIEKFHPSFYDSNGVSLVLVNTDKGERLWQELAPVLESMPSELEKAVVMNKNLKEPSSRPECRDGIYDGIDGDINRYFETKLAFKINPKTKLKKAIPLGIKNAVKKIKS